MRFFRAKTFSWGNVSLTRKFFLLRKSYSYQKILYDEESCSSWGNKSIFMSKFSNNFMIVLVLEIIWNWSFWQKFSHYLPNLPHGNVILPYRISTNTPRKAETNPIISDTKGVEFFSAPSAQKNTPKPYNSVFYGVFMHYWSKCGLF